MRQIKLVCDACEKEISYRHDYYSMKLQNLGPDSINDLRPNNFDLCTDCYNKMIEFMCTLKNQKEGDANDHNHV